MICLNFMIQLRPTFILTIWIHTVFQVFTISWHERIWERNLTLEFLDMNCCSRFICAGRRECSVKNSLIKCCTLFCKSKRTSLTERICSHFKRTPSNSCLTKNINSNNWSCPFSILSQNNSEISLTKLAKTILKRKKRTMIQLDKRMEEEKRITCLKGDLPRMKVMKKMKKMTSQKTRKDKMKKKMIMKIIIDQIDWWYLSLNSFISKVLNKFFFNFFKNFNMKNYKSFV